MENTRNLPEWPVLTSYDRDYLNRIALPLGGLGTGTISLGGRGNLRDFEIQNQPNKGFTPDYTFFALHVDGPQGAITRLLEGPLPPESYEGQRGSPEPQHGWPRFRECSFQAAYPLGQVHLSDPDLPVSARLQAFNPLVPADTEASGLPLAVLRYVVTNHTGDELAVSICGNTQNLNLEAGYNHFKTAPGLSGLLLTSPPREALPESGGTLALCTTVEDVTSRRGWPLLSWGDSLLDYWDDFHEDGQITQDRPGAPVTPHWLPVASLCARQTLAPRETRDFTFFFTWHFPDRQTWTGHRSDGSWHPEENTVGNYYANGFEDAWAAARHCAGMLPELEARTVEFVDAFVTCDLPQAVKEAALNNLSILRTETCFRTKDGHFFGFEGCHDKKGSCYGNCTHVWNYEQATAHLFGSLARSMREVEFLHATRANGFMPFRINLPLSRAQDYWVAAADGQMGCLMKLYRAGNFPAMKTSCAAPGLARAAPWNSVGSPAAGTRTRTGSWKAASTTPWMWSTSVPTPKWVPGTSARCARPRKWPAIWAKPNSRTAAGASLSTAAAGWTRICLTANITSTRFGRCPMRPPLRPACARGWAQRIWPIRNCNWVPAAWWTSSRASSWPTCADWVIYWTRNMSKPL